MLCKVRYGLSIGRVLPLLDSLANEGPVVIVLAEVGANHQGVVVIRVDHSHRDLAAGEGDCLIDVVDISFFAYQIRLIDEWMHKVNA